MLMEIAMKEIGQKIELGAKANIIILMVQYMKEHGLRINNMDQGLKLGQIKPNMLGNMIMERSMVKDSLSGQMVLHILVNSTIIILKERECINGLMDVNMRVNGKIIKCMVKVHSHGKMEENIQAVIKTTKSLDRENFFGQIKSTILDNG